MTNSLKISVCILLFLFMFWPFIVGAQSFYHWKAEAARRDWSPFQPEELIVSIFGEEEEKMAESTEYRIEINLPARRLFLYEYLSRGHPTGTVSRAPEFHPEKNNPNFGPNPKGPHYVGGPSFFRDKTKGMLIFKPRLIAKDLKT